MIISHSVLIKMRNVSDKHCREYQDIHFMFNNFFFQKSCHLQDVKKYGTAKQATDDNIIWSMCFAFWINTATDMHSEYVILLILHSNYGYKNGPWCCVYTYIAHRVFFLWLNKFMALVASDKMGKKGRMEKEVR